MMHIENGLSNGNFHLLEKSNENSPGGRLSPRIDEKTREHTECLNNIESLKGVNSLETYSESSRRLSNLNGTESHEKSSMQTSLENNKHCEIAPEILPSKVSTEDSKDIVLEVEKSEGTTNPDIVSEGDQSKTLEIEKPALLNVSEVIEKDDCAHPIENTEVNAVESKSVEENKSVEPEAAEESDISKVHVDANLAGESNKGDAAPITSKTVKEEPVVTDQPTLGIKDPASPGRTSTPNNSIHQAATNRKDIPNVPVIHPAGRSRKPLPGLINITASSVNAAQPIQQNYTEESGEDNLVNDISTNDTVLFNVVDRLRLLKQSSRADSSDERMFLVNLVKDLFRSKNDTNNTQASVEGSQKRRLSNNSPELQGNPHDFKYRRVDNSFPDHYPTPPTLFNETAMTSAHSSKNFLSQRQRENVYEMAQRQMANVQEQTPHTNRRSLFAEPQTKLMPMTNYAGIDFSSRQDNYPPLQRATNYNGGGSLQRPKAGPIVRNIPISQEYPTSYPAQQNSYLDSGIGSVTTASRPHTYADAVRLPVHPSIDYSIRDGFREFPDGPSTSRHLLPASSPSSTWSSFTGKSSRRPSVLNRERDIQEMQKYKELLAQHAPNIYNKNKSKNIEKAIRKGLTSINGGTQKLLSGLKNDVSHLLPHRRRSLAMTKAAQEQHAKTFSAFKQPLATKNKEAPLNEILSSTALKNNVHSEPTLATTINLADDDEEIDENDNDIEFISEPSLDAFDLKFSGIERSLNRRLEKNSMPTIILQDSDGTDDDVCEVIDLDTDSNDEKAEKTTSKKKLDLPSVEKSNIWIDQYNSKSVNWLDDYNETWKQQKKTMHEELSKVKEVAIDCTSKNFHDFKKNQHLLLELKVPDLKLLSIDEFAEPEPEPEPVLPELTDEHQARIKAAVYGPPDQVLISKFNMNITRRDIQTLVGHTWLNDEVINFYMNLLIERGEKKNKTHGYPKVHAMNTFFIPKLLQSGHAGVRRWTRKIDIFDKDVIPVPVHVGGVHWCMAIMHLKNRTIKYYDSMGTPNPNVLNALEHYLQDESMDKKQQPFDTSDFEVESVPDVPRQMNGSDCGVFSCMFAEFITRNREITFTQENMQYFRQKMIYEIVTGELMM